MIPQMMMGIANGQVRLQRRLRPLRQPIRQLRQLPQVPLVQLYQYDPEHAELRQILLGRL